MPRTPSHPTQSHEPSAGKSGRSRQTHFAVREVPIQIVLPPAAGGARFEGRLDAHWTTRMTSRTRVVMVGGEGVIRVPAFLLKDREGAFHEVPAGCLSLTRGDFSLPSAYAGMFPHLNEGVCDAKARTIIVSFGLLAIPDAAWNIESVPMKVVVRSFGTRERGEAVFAGGVGLITSGALRGGMLNGIAMRPQWPGGGGTPPGGTPPGGGGTAPGGGGTAPGGGGWSPFFPGGQQPGEPLPPYPGGSTEIEDAKSANKVKICGWSACQQPQVKSSILECKPMATDNCPSGCGCKLFSIKRKGGKISDWKWQKDPVPEADIKEDRIYACFCAKEVA